MATLHTLISAGVVVPIEIELDGQLPWRQLYGYPTAGPPNIILRWLHETLPTMISQVGTEDTPEEQVYGLLELFAAGDDLTPETMYRLLHPHEDGVWELKTIDVRIFGWFVAKDCFIAVFAGDATHIHNHGLHHGYINEVIRLRNELDLDSPKFVPGGPENVLSLRP